MAVKSDTPNASLRQKQEIFGILLMTLALLILISLVSYDPGEEPNGLRIIPVENAMGVLGVYLSYYLIKVFLGYPSIIVPFLLFAWGWNRFRNNEMRRLARATVFIFLTAVYVATILALPQEASPEFKFGYDFSGLVGGFFAHQLHRFFGTVGSIIILISLAMVTVVYMTQFSFERLVAAIIDGLRASTLWSRRQLGNLRIPSLPKRPPTSRVFRHPSPDIETRPQPQKPAVPERDEVPLLERLRKITSEEASSQTGTHNFSDVESAPEMPPPKRLFTEEHKELETGSITVTERGDRFAPTTDAALPPAPAIGDYRFPGLDLLDYPEGQTAIVSKDELLSNAKILEERLEEFDVTGHVVEINPGPVITRYEYEPAPGIKVSKITSLADDLALAMRAKRIRIVAPIPGKAAVGIELPNREPQTVYLRSILDTEVYRKSPSPLALALGKTIGGTPFVTELDKMPHLLVAGSTGSGKSVCLNAIIASILFKAHPTEVQFVLIDPKRLELSLYSQLHNHHLVFREDLDEVVVTTAANALAVLRSLEYEMELRYDLLASAGVRNIDDYNQRVRDGRIKGTADEPVLPLPRIVLVIDELADLMLTAAKEVEEPIARLTQMARAIGMHLIVATQRPSVDVITGVIKANFPARIAFAVASKTDSRTILDMNGAEKLLGRGDMLFLPPGSPEALRLHSAYISTDEIERILAHIQRQPRYPRKLLVARDEPGANAGGFGGAFGQRDELFNEALKLVVRHQQGSISLLQRRLKVGYARAARLIDELEAAGVVGSFDGSKAREVLIGEEDLEDLDLDTL